jgi:hypothetical protein
MGAFTRLACPKQNGACKRMRNHVSGDERGCAVPARASLDTGAQAPATSARTPHSCIRNTSTSSPQLPSGRRKRSRTSPSPLRHTTASVCERVPYGPYCGAHTQTDHTRREPAGTQTIGAHTQSFQPPADRAAPTASGMPAHCRGPTGEGISATKRPEVSASTSAANSASPSSASSAGLGSGRACGQGDRREASPSSRPNSASRSAAPARPWRRWACEARRALQGDCAAQQHRMSAAARALVGCAARLCRVCRVCVGGGGEGGWARLPRGRPTWPGSAAARAPAAAPAPSPPWATRPAGRCSGRIAARGSARGRPRRVRCCSTRRGRSAGPPTPGCSRGTSPAAGPARMHERAARFSGAPRAAAACRQSDQV